MALEGSQFNANYYDNKMVAAVSYFSATFVILDFGGYNKLSFLFDDTLYFV